MSESFGWYSPSGDFDYQLSEIARYWQRDQPEFTFPKLQLSLLADSNRLYFIFDSSGYLGAALFQVAAGAADIVYVHVNSERRKTGVGVRVLTEAFDSLRSSDIVAEVFLEVRPNNAAALSLYSRLGFVEMGRRSKYYTDGTDAILMKLQMEAMN